MWKAFHELREAGWVTSPMPRFYTVQSTGCAPMVKAFEDGSETATPWADPWTIASGLRVPGPLGDKLMLKILRESGGGVSAITDATMADFAARGTREEGVDWSPEGGAALAAAVALRDQGQLGADERVVVFNTGAGWLYRTPEDLLGPIQ